MGILVIMLSFHCLIIITNMNYIDNTVNKLLVSIKNIFPAILPVLVIKRSESTNNGYYFFASFID